MTEGELYVFENSPRCVFAYKGESRGTIYHYACVNSRDEVKIPGIGTAIGILSGRQTRIANEEERSRFYAHLHEYGYHYNMANRKVINIRTGEVL
jgi:hypothetical protein